MVTLSGRGYENFVTLVLRHLVGSKRVNLIISPIFHRDGKSVKKFQFYISYLASERLTAFEVNVNDLSDEDLVKNSKRWFLRRYQPLTGNKVRVPKISPGSGFPHSHNYKILYIIIPPGAYASAWGNYIS